MVRVRAADRAHLLRWEDFGKLMITRCDITWLAPAVPLGEDHVCPQCCGIIFVPRADDAH